MIMLRSVVILTLVCAMFDMHVLPTAAQDSAFKLACMITGLLDLLVKSNDNKDVVS